MNKLHLKLLLIMIEWNSMNYYNYFIIYYDNSTIMNIFKIIIHSNLIIINNNHI